MPIRDTAAMSASLNNDYGATKGPNAPASHELALFFGDPMVAEEDGGGVELTAAECPGYARVAVPNDAGWPAAGPDEGVKTRVVTFPAPTAEWQMPATHWALVAAGVWWDCNELDEPLEVTGAGTGPAVTVTIGYADLDDELA